MKKGYKHKTGLFGKDAEFYVSQLFMLMRNPNGHRRPDLVSANGRYSPRLTLEVKSGKGGKGIMVDYQRHYGVTTAQDYIELFGEKPKPRSSLLPGFEMPSLELESGRIAFYYDIIERVDGLPASGLDRPYASIKIQWGNQHLVPHDFAFFSFAASRALHKGISMPDSIKELKEIVKKDLEEKSSHYSLRKGQPQSWQSLSGNDIRAVFENNSDLASKSGRERINLMNQHYNLQALKRISIPGPNQTTIYVLAKPEDINLFEIQARKTIEERAKPLEKITEERASSMHLLSHIRKYWQDSLPSFNHSPHQSWNLRLSASNALKLHRLSQWLSEGESSFIH